MSQNVSEITRVCHGCGYENKYGLVSNLRGYVKLPSKCLHCNTPQPEIIAHISGPDSIRNTAMYLIAIEESAIKSEMRDSDPYFREAGVCALRILERIKHHIDPSYKGTTDGVCSTTENVRT